MGEIKRLDELRVTGQQDLIVGKPNRRENIHTCKVRGIPNQPHGQESQRDAFGTPGLVIQDQLRNLRHHQHRQR